MSYKVIDHQVVRGRVIFTVKRTGLFGLFSKPFKVCTDQDVYMHHNYTVVMSWPACKILMYIHPVVQFINSELTRMVIEGDLNEQSQVYTLPEHAKKRGGPPPDEL